MRVLGLDPSMTNFGWAVHDSSATGLTRCVGRGRFQTSSKTLYIERYKDLRERLRALLKEHRPDHMGIEFPVFNSDYSEGLYGLFLYCSEAIYDEGVDVVFWSPLQIKAHARESLERPKGWVMMKPDMVEAAKVDTGFKGTWNHNEADAYLCARLSARFWMLYDGLITEVDLTQLERRYFLEVKEWTRGKKAGTVQQKGLMYREDERFFRWSENNHGGSKVNDEGSEGRCSPEDGEAIDDPGCGQEGPQD